MVEKINDISAAPSSYSRRHAARAPRKPKRCLFDAGTLCSRVAESRWKVQLRSGATRDGAAVAC